MRNLLYITFLIVVLFGVLGGLVKGQVQTETIVTTTYVTVTAPTVTLTTTQPQSKQIKFLF